MGSAISIILPLLVLAVILWPRPQRKTRRRDRTVGPSKRRQLTAQDIANHSPITSQVAANKALAELLHKANYFSGDRFMNAEAKREFRDGLKNHLQELISTIQAFDEEVKKETDHYNEFHDDASDDDKEPEEARSQHARVRKMTRVRDQLQTELHGLRTDMTHIVVAYANHVHNKAPNPLIQQRDESPYGM